MLRGGRRLLWGRLNESGMFLFWNLADVLAFETPFVLPALALALAETRWNECPTCRDLAQEFSRSISGPALTRYPPQHTLDTRSDREKQRQNGTRSQRSGLRMMAVCR